MHFWEGRIKAEETPREQETSLGNLAESLLINVTRIAGLSLELPCR